jgi:hypothetical protein
LKMYILGIHFPTTFDVHLLNAVKTDYIGGMSSIKCNVYIHIKNVDFFITFV